MRPQAAIWCTGMSLALAGVPPGTSWHAAELGHGESSVWAATATTVYRDPAAFRAGWAQLYPVAAFRPALPAVDFTKWRVVIAAIGTRPTGGYFLTLERGQVVSDSAVLMVTLHAPPKGCAVTEELTRPAIAIATPLAPAPFRIIFAERTDSTRCR